MNKTRLLILLTKYAMCLVWALLFFRPRPDGSQITYSIIILGITSAVFLGFNALSFVFLRVFTKTEKPEFFKTLEEQNKWDSEWEQEKKGWFK